MIKNLKKISKLFLFVKKHFHLLTKLKVIKKRQIVVILSLGSLTVFFEILGLSVLIPTISFIENRNNLEEFQASSIFAKGIVYAFSALNITVSLLSLSIVAFLATLLRQINNYINIIYNEKVKWTVDKKLQKKLFEIIMNSNSSFISRFKGGHLANITASEVPQAAAVFRCYGAIWTVTNTILAYLVFLFITAPKITLAIIILSLIIMVLSFSFISKTKKYSESNLKYRNFYREFVLEKFYAWKLIRLNNKLQAESSSLSQIQNNIFKNEIKLIKIAGLLSLIFIPSLTLILLIGLNISISLLQVQLTLIITFSIAFLRMLPTIITLQKNFNNLIKYIPSCTHIERTINEAYYEAEDIEKGLNFSKLEKSIQFNNVSFSYKNRKKIIINKLSFFIEAGSLFGINGPSGSGKSTIVEMIPRILYPTAGTISFDGQNVNNISLKSLRKSIAYLPQEPILFNTTLRENMIFVKKNASDNEIWNALKMAKAEEFVKSFPDKLDTQVGLMGKSLSGGQRQRIVLARAFLQNPSILILDEPTSALDANTENYIQKILKKFKNNMHTTIILISHRPSAIMKCDKTLYIKNGIGIEK